MPFAATRIHLEIIISEVRGRLTNIIWYHVYTESKDDTNKLINKTKADLVIKGSHMVIKGESRGRDTLDMHYYIQKR